MKPALRTARIIELALWLAAFAWVFSHGDSGANLIFVWPLVVLAIGARLALSVMAGAFASVWRGLAGR
jgi:hypothetical protein